MHGLISSQVSVFLTLERVSLNAAQYDTDRVMKKTSDTLSNNCNKDIKYLDKGVKKMFQKLLLGSSK
jgi:hypothetical protein